MNNKKIEDRYVAFFLTTNNVEDCRVCGWGLMNCADPTKTIYGSTINSFMTNLKTLGTPYVYFPNLSFEGCFILDYMLKNGFSTNTKQKNSFSSTITYDNIFYSIDIYFTSAKTRPLRKAKILDLRKLINMEIPKIHQKFRVDLTKFHFNLEEKEKIAKRIGLTPKDLDEIQYSLGTMRESLKNLFDLGLTNNTISSCAFNYFVDMCGGRDSFKNSFPDLTKDIDAYCRDAYRGGYVFLNTAITSKPIGGGLVLDINSLYAYVMSTKPMPKGNPIYFVGKPKPDKYRRLFICQIRCALELKEDGIPTLQIHSNVDFDPTKYITSTDGIVVTLTLTSVDLKLMFENYYVYNLEWVDGYSFKESNNKFKSYVDKWVGIKIEADKTNNAGMRQSAKLMLNGLGGKFGTKTIFRTKDPVIRNGVVGYGEVREREVNSIYTPVACFMTAYGREILINTIKANKERALYGDTDSIHLSGMEIPNNIKIDSYELGAWKIEAKFVEAIYAKAKTYIQKCEDNTYRKHIAGMPEEDLEQVSMENFGIGSVYIKNIKTKVPGGAVLLPQIHKITD